MGEHRNLRKKDVSDSIRSRATTAVARPRVGVLPLAELQFLGRRGEAYKLPALPGQSTHRGANEPCKVLAHRPRRACVGQAQDVVV
eukprot:6094637-Prymnesium_polylepis.1